MSTLTVWSNTRLDAQRNWPVDELIELFQRSSQYQLPGDLAERLQLFLTDQDGPVRGVCCDDAALATLVAAMADFDIASGKEVA